MFQRFLHIQQLILYLVVLGCTICAHKLDPVSLSLLIVGCLILVSAVGCQDKELERPYWGSSLSYQQTDLWMRSCCGCGFGRSSFLLLGHHGRAEPAKRAQLSWHLCPTLHRRNSQTK